MCLLCNTIIELIFSCNCGKVWWCSFLIFYESYFCMENVFFTNFENVLPIVFLTFVEYGGLTLKRLGVGLNFTSNYGFSKNEPSRETLKPCFFCDFWYYSHLSWNSIWNSSNRPEDMKIFSININYFHQFSDLFTLPCYKETNTC